MVSHPPYKIVLHKEVLSHDSLHFDTKTKERIKKKCIELLSHEPDKVGEFLHDDLHPYRKLKIFDEYRIIYKVSPAEAKVFILAIGIRRNEEVYKQALKRLRNNE